MSAPSEEMPSPGRCGMPVSLCRRARRRIRLSFDSYLEPTSSSSGTTSCERSKSSCGGRGVVLRSQTREIVDRVRQYFENEKKLINRGVEDIREAIPFDNVLKRTSEATGISVRSILRVHKQISVAEEQGKSVVTPGKKRPRESFKGMDSFAEDAIRRHVYDYFSRKEYPTLNKLKVSLADTGLFEGSVFTVNKLMHKLGFEYKKINSRKLLMEKPEIAAARSRFLKEIVREDCNKIVWLDETWVNAGHAKSKGWTDNTKAGTSLVPVGKGTPFGMVPVLEEDGRIVGQSNAIARYLARRYGLAGKNEWEALQCDAIVDTLADLKQVLWQYRTEQEVGKKEDKRAAIMKEVIPFYLKRFEKIIRENGGLAVGNCITWADFVIAVSLENFEILFGKDSLDAYPQLKALKEKIFNIPQIEAWIKKRPYSEF